VSELNPQMLHTRHLEKSSVDSFSLPRRYTLTHSDRTGELFLTVGKHFDKKQISGMYTRFMRDEVLAEWIAIIDGYELHVHCHVSGGVVFGGAGMRCNIFRGHMRLVLEAIRYGDRAVFDAMPVLDASVVLVHFSSTSKEFDSIENYGTMSDYRISY